MTLEQARKSLDTLEMMMDNGYKRYKVDSEITFEFFTYDELQARIRYFEDKIAKLEGNPRNGSGKTIKRKYEK